MALTLLIVTGQFASYTFIRPLLQEMAHFPDSAIGILLLIYGIFGILGNFILGFTIQKFLWQTLFVIASLLSITLFLFMFLGHSPLLSILLLFIWGLAYGGVSVSLMTWMIRSAPDHIELGSAFNIAIFNLSIGLGAFLGGVIYDGIGLEINLVFSCILTCLAAILVLSYRHR